MKESSNKNNPQKLEDLFRQTLGEAEVTPPDKVWERIAQGLDSKEAGYYKERVGWYRSLAAACIFLVVFAAGYMFYDFKYAHSSQQTIAQQTATGNLNAPAANKTNKSQLAQTPPTSQESSSLSAASNHTLSNKVIQAEKISVSENKKSPALGNANQNKVSFPNIATPNKFSRNTYAAVTAENLPATTETTNVGRAGEAPRPEPEPDGLKSVSVGLISGINQVPVWADMNLIPEKPNLQPNTLALLPEPAADETHKNRTGRWSFNAKYAPQYFNQNIQLTAQSNRSLANNSLAGTASFSAPSASNLTSNSYTQALNEYDNNTTGGFSYNTAVAAGYLFNEHWSLESGLTFTQNVANSSSSYIFNNTSLAGRYNITPQNSNQNDNKRSTDPMSILPATALLASLSGQQNIHTATVVQTPTFNTQYRYRLIGVPVRLHYQTSQRKSFYFASVGFLTNMLVQAHVLSGSAKVPDLKYQGQADSPFRTWQVAATVSAGRGFRISKAVNLRAGFEGTQNLNSLAAHPEYLANGKGKPYTIGVAFSSSYTLGL